MDKFGPQDDTTTRLNSPGSKSTIVGQIFRVGAQKGPLPEGEVEVVMMGAAIETSGERRAPAWIGACMCHGRLQGH